MVNINVGTLLQITQQKKNRQCHEKIYLKKIISDRPTLIFSRYETIIIIYKGADMFIQRHKTLQHDHSP